MLILNLEIKIFLHIFATKTLNNMEIWKDIKGYEGIYQISNELEKAINNNGGVQILNERIINPHINNRGRLIIRLYANDDVHNYQISRLIAEAFIPNPNNYNVVHHKNHNKTDNRVANLIWIDFAKHTKLHHSKIVYQYTLDGKLVKIWESQSECGRNGYNQSAISACCRGEHKTHKGYKWSYEPL